MVERYQRTGGTPHPVDLISGMIPLAEADQAAVCGSFKINLEKKIWNSNHVFGGVKRYQNSATILYAGDLSTCWRRFVIAKELSHVIFDQEDNYTKNPIELVGSLLAGIALSEGAIAAVTSEQHAVLMAMELILPHSCRDEIEGMHRSGFSTLKIATEFRVPERVVENYLRDDYKKLASECWSLRHS